MLYIISGTYDQARYFAIEKGIHISKWKYISYFDQLRGLTDFEYALTGTWWERKDSNEIVDLINYNEELGRAKKSSFSES